MRSALSSALLALVLTGAAVAQPSLGETTFANSGAADAQEPFLRGLLLLHSFEYDDAREAFQQARRIDPGFAMAAWGEAMTHNHPVWQRQDLGAARAALAGVTGDGATDRERAYLTTLAVLFGEGDKESRDDRYADAVRQLAEDFPGDLDAQAFYALALLGTAHEGRDFTVYMKAAAVAEEVFSANPRHPGAAHYLIHAYDDPVHAPLGLRPARVYAGVAPAASHALHMPSHITLALGLWPETAEMNERSYLAAKAGTDRRGQALNGHGWHALWWWHYAATQLGDRPLAGRLAALALDHARADPDDATAQAHVARVAAQHAAAFDDPAVLADPLVRADAGAHTRALVALAQAATLADPAARRRLADELGELAADSDASWAVRAAAFQLDGQARLASGDADGGLAALRRAAQVETEAPLTFGPPSPVVPSSEALGWALVETGDPDGARAAFEAALARAPGRRQSLAGLAAAQAGR